MRTVTSLSRTAEGRVLRHEYGGRDCISPSRTGERAGIFTTPALCVPNTLLSIKQLI